MTLWPNGCGLELKLDLLFDHVGVVRSTHACMRVFGSNFGKPLSCIVFTAAAAAVASILEFGGGRPLITWLVRRCAQTVASLSALPTVIHTRYIIPPGVIQFRGVGSRRAHACVGSRCANQEHRQKT